jgi:hypothetical protein
MVTQFIISFENSIKTKFELTADLQTVSDTTLSEQCLQTNFLGLIKICDTNNGEEVGSKPVCFKEALDTYIRKSLIFEVTVF